MGRWAEAFQTSVAMCDTADTVDTSSAEPVDSKQSVSSVNSVTQASEPGNGPSTSSSDLVSAVSTVSCQATNGVEAAALAAYCERRAAEALDGYEPQPPAPDWPGGRAPPAELNRRIVDGYRRAALRRPPSWWRAEAHRPTPNATCACCDGQRWWSSDQRGWCCWTCHPPHHLSVDTIVEVRT
jgi:hypothetical protein